VPDAADLSFGELLRRARRAAGLTQEALAERARISVRGISDLERGVNRTPRKDTLELIADALALPEEERRQWERLRRRITPAATSRLEDKDAQPLERVLTSPSTIVGRESEQVALRDLLADALEGRGRLVLVSGAAGIGKSALVADLCHAATGQGALVLSGACYDLTATPPYGLWIDVGVSASAFAGMPPLPSLFSESHDTSRSGSQAEWFAEARQFLRKLSARRPLVVVLEDLHWADAESLDLLRYLARHLGGQRILLVATYRDDEVTRNHPLHPRLPALIREANAERLALRPLAREHVRALVNLRYRLQTSDLRRLIEFLDVHAEGVPLFVHELLRGLEEAALLAPGADDWQLVDLSQAPVPRLIRQVIERRLERFDDETQRYFRIAAVIGHEVPLDVWQEVSEATDQGLIAATDSAVDGQILIDVPERYAVRFSHTLVRETIYRGTVSPRRRAVHRQVADALISRSPIDADAIAYHLQQAGDRRAVGWLIRAGVRARETLAWLTAGERLAAAAALLEHDEEHARERGWLLYYAADMLELSGDPRRFTLLAAAEKIATRFGDDLLSQRVKSMRGLMLLQQGNVREGLSSLEQAAAKLDDNRAELQGFDLAVVLPGIRRLAPDLVDQTIERWRSQSSHLRPKGSHRSVLGYWWAMTGRFADALSLGEVLMRHLALDGGDSGASAGPLPAPHFALGLPYAALGRSGDASMSFEIVRDAYWQIDSGVVEHAAWAELAMVTIPYQSDDLDRRAWLVRQAETAWEQSSGISFAGPAEHSLSYLFVSVLEGRWTEARALAELLRASPASGQAHPAIALQAELALYQGESDLAWSCVSELVSRGPATDPGDSLFMPAIAAQEVAANLALIAGDLDAARQWIEARERWVDWSGATLWRAENQLLWAEYHRAANDQLAARKHAERALELAAEPRQPLVQLAAHRFLGVLANKATEFEEARRHLDASLALADACVVPFERALTLLSLAQLHQVTSQPDQSRSLLAEARETFKQLGARPALERADALENQIGGRSRSGAPYGLTSRELDVLRLLVEGKSDREIADSLFISPRTVMHHVSHILAKLDVDSRTAAATFAVRHDLV
jgi:DNA-binding CsgD family transcriptional regulator/transcriptional regulator with XRE-family HTH domain